MKNKIIASILFTGLSLGTACAQNLNKPKMDSLFNILAEKNKAMGSLTLSKNGNVLYSRAIGYSSISDKGKTAATENTIYRIGSISKMFTATMIFQLIEEGKLKLDTKLDKFFPKLPNAKKITIGNLLNHRSGLHNFTDDPNYKSWETQPKTQDEMLAIISKPKVDFQPNEKAEYSNSNYVVLGYIIEKISKNTYANNLNERITSKIGLSNTYCGIKARKDKEESLSYQYTTDWKQKPETDMSIAGGAGSIVSTPAELTQFIQALFSEKLVSKSSLDQMKTITDGYGMGMFQIPFYEKKALGHSGAIDGFLSNAAYFPEDGLAIAYCSNGVVYPVNDIMIGVLSIYFDRKYKVPTFNTLSVNTDDLNKYLGVYSSKAVPLKITITKDNSTLMAQATGQSPFPIEATEKDKFKFDQAGIEMEFDTAKNEFILKQGGGNYLFTRDK